MELVHTTIPIGLEKPVKVLHVTDTHLPLYDDSEPQRIIDAGKRRGNPEPALRALREQMAYARQHCDLLLHTGDLIDFVSGANLAFLRDFLREENVLMIAGNHEYWRCDGGYEDMAYRMESLSLMDGLGEDLMFTSRTVGGVNFVGIDDVYHQVEAWQTERLRAEAAKGLPVVLFMHAPLFEQALFERSVAYWGDGTAYLVGCDEAHLATYPAWGAEQQRPTEATRAFVDYVCGEPRIRAVVTGHVHFHFESRLPGGTPQYVTDCSCRSAAREITLL